jgi:signal transduction histidine kinase
MQHGQNQSGPLQSADSQESQNLSALLMPAGPPHPSPRPFKQLLSVERPSRTIVPLPPDRHNPAPPTRNAPIGFAAPAMAQLNPVSVGDLAHDTAMLAHDLRNMVAALELYCDLLAEPGVLSVRSRHYAEDLRMVATASRRLAERLIEPRDASDAPGLAEASISDLALELEANRGLLTALAGDAVTLGISITGSPLYPAASALPARITPAEFTRLLVNLVRNAAEAMPSGGHIQIALRRHGSSLRLTVADCGPGIPPSALVHIFSPGYTTHVSLNPISGPSANAVPSPRGLGLAIVRSIAAAAGGRVWAANRAPNRDTEFATYSARGKPSASPFTRADMAGAVLSVELPVAF